MGARGGKTGFIDLKKNGSGREAFHVISSRGICSRREMKQDAYGAKEREKPTRTQQMINGFY